jgi:Uma2 family endonuclease
LDFLEKYYDIFLNIERGPSLKYMYNGQNKVYHSDFFIPSLNLVIEIKSSWTLKLDIEIEEKRNEVLKNNLKYIMVIDKKYSEFDKLYLY